MIKYKIGAPSRHRPEKMKTLLALLPSVHVFVNEDEQQDYLDAGVPRKQLIGLPPVNSITKRYQEILDYFDEEGVVLMDDDLQGVWSIVGHTVRRMYDPGAIQQIIENALHIAKGMDTSLFGWRRSYKFQQFRPYHPFGFVGIIAGAMGVIGRDLRFDLKIDQRGEDIDLTMQCLLKKRIVYIDDRFIFDFGNITSSAGGLQGMRTEEKDSKDKLYLKEKWGSYIKFKDNKLIGTEGISIIVKRRQSVT